MQCYSEVAMKHFIAALLLAALAITPATTQAVYLGRISAAAPFHWR
jgi:hypothetical protein